MLTIENLHKSFQSKEVLHGINMNVEDGKIYGFIGHNGAGKTTTLRCVVGILDFNQGTILIDGHDIQKDPIACKKNIAYLPDNPDLYETMTGIQYLNFICDIFEIDADKRHARIEELGKKFEIYDRLGDPIKSLSHGMKQKVAVISALVHEPKLMVMDEPFVGLDPKASHLLKMEMKAMCENGASILFSSHVLEVVENLCDEIAIIQKGTIVKQGNVDELLDSGVSLEDYFLNLEEAHEE